MSFHFVVCAGPVGRETARLLGEEGQFGKEAPKILSFSPGVRGVVGHSKVGRFQSAAPEIRQKRARAGEPCGAEG